jgi:hypothetical protein
MEEIIVAGMAAEAVRDDDAGVAASEVRRLEERVRELERLLGRKTTEVEILKEAVDLARALNRQCCRTRRYCTVELSIPTSLLPGIYSEGGPDDLPMPAIGAQLPMGRRRHGEDGPSRFIANDSMHKPPLSTHFLGPPGWLTRVESKGFSGDHGAKLCSRAP